MIKNKLFTVWHHITAAAIVLWRHLPRVALYTLTFFVLFSVADRVYYKIEPADHFVNYTSFIVQNAREGEDVPFTLCRTHRADYEVSGIRTIYVIPEGKGVAQRVFVHNDRLNGEISGANCSNYFIKNSDYHHPTGSYQMTINVQFKVKYGEWKQVAIQSNVYRIYPSADNADVETQLNNLQAQIDVLQNVLKNIGVQFNIPINTPIKPAPTTSAPNEASGNSSAPGTAPSSVTPATPAPNSTSSGGTHEVCTVNLLGVKLNCRQVPN
jgi:hypothetical protein